MYAHKIDSLLFESSIIILEVVYKSYEIYYKNLQCLVMCNKNKKKKPFIFLINNYHYHPFSTDMALSLYDSYNIKSYTILHELLFTLIKLHIFVISGTVHWL